MSCTGRRCATGAGAEKSLLIAFIDDATRVIPFAAFAYSDNTTAFLPVFKQTIARRGLPMRLCADNGANYRSQQRALVCAKLRIALLHSRPYQPAGKGTIERFFRTLRATWLAHLSAEATESLQTLNRPLWAWVEGEHHRSPHRGLNGRTPLDQGALAGHDVRYPDPGTDLDDLFLFEAKRQVMKDRTVSLNARLYEADAGRVGEPVTLRYDPHAPPARPIEVVHDAKAAGAATRLDAYPNTRVKRHRPSWQPHCDTPPSQPSPSPLAMRHLKREAVMSLRHFALTRLPFETPAHTDELFESNPAARPTRGCIPSSSSRASASSPARSARGKPPCAATSPPPCIAPCTASATSP